MGSELRPRRRDRCHCRGLQTRPPRPRPTCGALPAGAVRAASLNGGRKACAPTSTITPAPPVPRSRVQPDGHSLHPQTCHCTRSARENTSRSGCIFCIRAPAAAPALATSQRSSGGRSRSCGNGSSSGCECSASSKQQLSVCARPHTSQTYLGFQRSQAALVDNGAAWTPTKHQVIVGDAPARPRTQDPDSCSQGPLWCPPPPPHPPPLPSVLAYLLR
jgi:hypothetical protein